MELWSFLLGDRSNAIPPTASSTNREKYIFSKLAVYTDPSVAGQVSSRPAKHTRISPSTSEQETNQLVNSTPLTPTPEISSEHAGGEESSERVEKQRFIFMMVNCNSLHLRQINATKQSITQFADELRKACRDVRGFW
jgi:hypothetical protein